MRYLIALILALALLLIPAEDAQSAGPYYVATTGSNAGAGTIGDPWETIDYAVDNCAAGDTIYVRAGTYNERVTFGVSGTAGNVITLTNYNDEEVIVDGTGAFIGSWKGIIDIRVNKDYITVDGLTIRDAVYSTDYQAGVFIYNGCDHITIQNCTIHNTNMSGICAWGDSNELTNISVLSNEIYDTNWIKSQEAVSIWIVDTFEVAYNEVHDCNKEGIDAKGGSDNGTIHHNHVYDCGGPGIYLDTGGTGDGTSEYIDIYNNFCHDIGDYGVLGYDYRAGISLEVEKVDGILQYVNIYNNISGFGCTQGGLWFGERSTSGKMIQYIDVYNNTFHCGTDYQGAIGVECLPAYLENVDIYNNILCGDRTDNRMLRFRSGYSPSDYTGFTGDYNLYEQASTYDDSDMGGTHGIGPSVDPLFVSSPSSNEDSYYLQSTSPAVNSGSATWAPATDYDDSARPQDGVDDIGAYEYLGDAPPTPEPGDTIIVYPFDQTDLSVVFPLITSSIYMIYPLLW